jgi:hypothetical protein
MKRVTNIDRELTQRLMDEALPLLTDEARRWAAVTKVYVTHAKAGRASAKDKVIRVPAWVFDGAVNFCGKGPIAGGANFAAYYLAHELSHIKAPTGNHGRAFMSAFIALCPPALRWYEALYKPRSAGAAGICDLRELVVAAEEGEGGVDKLIDALEAA